MKKKSLIGSFIVILAIWSTASFAAPVDREYSKANKLFAKKNYSQALLIYQTLLSEPDCSIPTSILRIRIADVYFQLEDYHNALREYRIALSEQKASERVATQYWIAVCTIQAGTNEEAVEEFLKIPRLYPNTGRWISTAYYEIGRIYSRIGKKDLAAEYYRKAAAGSGKSTQGKFALKKAEAAKGK